MHFSGGTNIGYFSVLHKSDQIMLPCLIFLIAVIRTIRFQFFTVNFSDNAHRATGDNLKMTLLQHISLLHRRIQHKLSTSCLSTCNSAHSQANEGRNFAFTFDAQKFSIIVPNITLGADVTSKSADEFTACEKSVTGAAVCFFIFKLTYWSSIIN